MPAQCPHYILLQFSALIIMDWNLISWSHFFPIFPKTFDSSDIHYIRNLFNIFSPPPLYFKAKTYFFYLFHDMNMYCLLVTCPMFSMQFKKNMLILKLLWNKHISILSIYIIQFIEIYSYLKGFVGPECWIL